MLGLGWAASALLLAPPSAAQVASTAAVATSTAAPRVGIATSPAVPGADWRQAPRAPRLDVVWPKDGDKFPFLTRSFTFGNASPGSTVTVNGRPVGVDEDGTFFEMTAFSSGVFSLRYDAVLNGMSVSTRHAVEVGPPGGFPETGPRELKALEPAVDKELPAGDVLWVRCKGPPGFPGTFSVRGLARGLPLVESSAPARGVYEGFYVIRPRDEGKDLPISCSLKTGLWSGLEAAAPGRVSILDLGRPRVAATTAKSTVLKTLPGGYSLFFPAGIRLAITGRSGTLARAALGDGLEGWVDTGSIQLLPEGTPPPRGVIGQNAGTVVGPDAVRLAVEASAPLPFEVRHRIDPLSFEVRFFGALQRFDRIRYAPDDPVVREVRWRQESARVVAVTVETRLKWGWGYDAYYDAGGRFILEIRRPPGLTRSRNVMAGRRIVVDPGHGGPDIGAVGPRATTERELNLSIAQRLAELLRENEAQVYLIRTSTEGPALADRPSEAWKARGDLYVSVHLNALPVTADPAAQPRGFMVFYYHPQSRPLADAVHRSYQLRLPDVADESLQWGDLLVCRTTQMPAILTESDYVIFPDREKRLLEPLYQKKLAATMFAGIQSFYETYRDIQSKSEDEQRAARKE